MCEEFYCVDNNMTSNVLFYLVLLLAYNIQCESFSLHTGLSRIVRLSQIQEINVEAGFQSKRSNLKMSSTENTVTEIQLGRVTMYKKEGSSALQREFYPNTSFE